MGWVSEIMLCSYDGLSIRCSGRGFIRGTTDLTFSEVQTGILLAIERMKR